jgi:hypothetical protein
LNRHPNLLFLIGRTGDGEKLSLFYYFWRNPTKMRFCQGLSGLFLGKSKRKEVRSTHLTGLILLVNLNHGLKGDKNL